MGQTKKFCSIALALATDIVCSGRYLRFHATVLNATVDNLMITPKHLPLRCENAIVFRSEQCIEKNISFE